MFPRADQLIPFPSDPDSLAFREAGGFMPRKVLALFGTRPEVIKLAPVIYTRSKLEAMAFKH